MIWFIPVNMLYSYIIMDIYIMMDIENQSLSFVHYYFPWPSGNDRPPPNYFANNCIPLKIYYKTLSKMLLNLSLKQSINCIIIHFVKRKFPWKSSVGPSIVYCTYYCLTKVFLLQLSCGCEYYSLSMTSFPLFPPL